MRRLIYMLLVSCMPDVPETPSFQQDVAPILAANCVRCHGTVPLSAPTNLRLDTYDDLLLREGLDGSDPVCLANRADPRCAVILYGAKGVAQSIAERIVDPENPMPPRFSLDDYQIEILQRWSDLDAPLRRGSGRIDNQLPTARVEAIDGTVIDIVVSDSDRDLVGGALLVEVENPVPVPNTVLVIGAIAGGRQQLTWHPDDVVPGTHVLRAEIDDGAGTVIVELGTITVEAP